MNVLICFGALLIAFAPLHATAQASGDLRFGSAVKAVAEQPADGGLVPLSAAFPPADLAAGAEVMVVSGYEPASGRGGVVKLHIDRPGKKLLLVLTSYHAAQWQVSASPQTKVAGIIVSARASDETSTLRTAATNAGYSFRLPYVRDADHLNFQTLMTELNSLFEIDKVDVLRAGSRVPASLTISTLDPPSSALTRFGDQPAAAARDFEFDVLATDLRKVKWSLSGPRTPDARGYTNEPVAVSPDGKRVYKINSHRLEVRGEGDQVPSAPSLPINFPAFSWPTDVAYDSKRDILSLVSLGGEGFLYRLDAKRNVWLDFRSLNNIDINSFAYDASKDRYVAWTTDQDLIFISGDGQPIARHKVPVESIKALGRFYDRGNRQMPRLVLAPRGDDVAFLLIQDFVVKAIWHVDVKNAKVTLTYRDGAATPGDSRPPPNFGQPVKARGD
jgi:hypothetical protein